MIIEKERLAIHASDLAFGYQERGASTFELAVGSLDLKPGVVVALYGPNGSGKTTLLRLLGGACRPTRGTVTWSRGGKRLEQLRLGADLVITNSAGPFPHWTVRENLSRAYPTGRLDETQLRALSAEWGLETLLHRRSHELSAGQQQRVVLARALAVGATVYLLDEITSAQSESWAMRIGLALKELASRGCTLLVVSHDPMWVSAYADRVIELGAENGHGSTASHPRASSFQIVLDDEASNWRREDRRFGRIPPKDLAAR